ncbi:MAG: large subunit ribosomal protein [Methanothermococcus sp.]|jgi:large subunit ribosomal protein L1|uniref:Large ribosomal subunit protein uL1 n=1 Tax=Methanothermococcus thermolithotrophicus TaxID=2186 RepID=RL1_METTL|nr:MULTISPECIES: 50S ribosomal protein L1 [Methanothermococcus]O52704.1 RecName: Full=Large ribosomal subunit protein uL1; AltName: Full=50S ribosomal protein L1; AltName: Full=ML6; AltName: Full=MvaL1 [Methanothermococcus thermolithotrophicus]1DWU_A Chain A, RIBOSOMAL PROTEIN L1 [Methanothermococcus thermolithotrophicus]1DWU_B Chain B, RIBOSOMAL PROTEIN L1 [Methanothermococcus thermolithotrophicus]AAC64510.1 ribosomal protein L1 [Methanothermococcus thermolithotrophicus]MDK2790900.1 large sub
MDRENILKAVKEARSLAKPRNFTQSLDLIINLKELDLSRPENRLKEQVVLPNGRGKEPKIAVIAKGDLAAQAEEMGLTVIRQDELEELGKNKKMAKKIANEHDFFIAQADMMPLVGKTLGPVLGPRGKMPQPVPANANLTPLVERLKKTVLINTRDKPLFHVLVGNEKMSDEELAENIEAILNTVSRKYEKGLYHVKSAYTKLTMGPPAQIEK